MILFELILPGTPVSAQCRNKASLKAWRERLAQEAQRVWPAGSPPVMVEVSLRITYFYDSAAPDVDNIVKPIQDALKGIVYADDDQVTEATSRKSKLDGAFRIRGVSKELAIHLAQGKDFIQIQVLPAPRHEELR